MRQAPTLRDDRQLEVVALVVVEVEGAQKEILGVARKLADAGKIMLGGGSAEQFV